MIGTGSSRLDVDLFFLITLWIAMHTLIQDPFVKQANVEQYRSRSAYKLIELDDKFHFLRRRSIVVRNLQA